MSTITFEQALSQVKALSPEDTDRLRDYLNAQHQQDEAAEKARALAHAASLRDLSAEYRWIEEHRDEYVGQWVALKGDQLISSSLRGKEAYDAAVVAGHPDAFMLLIEPKDDRPFVNI
ncbi:MAG: hypothetical protein AB7U82_15035 [Blastocatellales bacterium]